MPVGGCGGCPCTLLLPSVSGVFGARRVRDVPVSTCAVLTRASCELIPAYPVLARAYRSLQTSNKETRNCQVPIRSTKAAAKPYNILGPSGSFLFKSEARAVVLIVNSHLNLGTRLQWFLSSWSQPGVDFALKVYQLFIVVLYSYGLVLVLVP